MVEVTVVVVGLIMVMVAQQMVRLSGVVLPLLLPAASELGVPAIPPLLGSASSPAASSVTGAGPSWDSADKHILLKRNIGHLQQPALLLIRQC